MSTSRTWQKTRNDFCERKKQHVNDYESKLPPNRRQKHGIILLFCQGCYLHNLYQKFDFGFWRLKTAKAIKSKPTENTTLPFAFLYYLWVHNTNIIFEKLIFPNAQQTDSHPTLFSLFLIPSETVRVHGVRRSWNEETKDAANSQRVHNNE